MSPVAARAAPKTAKSAKPAAKSGRSGSSGGGSSLLDEVRARRDARDEERENKWAQRTYKREQQGKADAERDAYESGRAEERQRPGAKGKSGGKSGGKQSAARRPVSRIRSRRPSRSAKSELGKGAQALVTPVKTQLTSGLQFLGMSLAVAALYLVLTSEEQTHTFTSALGGLQKALRWLADPNSSIGYGPPDDTTQETP